MEPLKPNENPTCEKPEVAWDEEFSLSKGSCCDDGEAFSPTPFCEVNVS